jgi:hypothetical protein
MRPHAQNRNLKLTGGLQTLTFGVSCVEFTCGEQPTFIVTASSGGLAGGDVGGTSIFGGGFYFVRLNGSSSSFGGVFLGDWAVSCFWP